MSGYDPIALGIHWDRLISIADEIVTALVRTSFSTNVRESYDLSCILFDAKGRALAQGAYSVPSFTGTAPLTMRHMLERFPPDTLAEGDIIATNDPWLGTGHLFDINVMRPVFKSGRLVGYTMSITHLPDIGGGGFSAAASEVYEEGLRLPVCRLAKAGRLNEELMEIIRTNVRVPEQTLGDIMANVACNEVGGRMLTEFMEEYAIADLAPLADAIIGFSEEAIRAELRRVPAGVYRNRIEVEGDQAPLTLAASVAIADGEASIDFAGSSPAVRAAINVPYCYTRAIAAYAIKCLTTPKIPNNEGSVRPILVAAPEGSVLNALPPSPTGGRHIIGHFINPLIFGALAPALPDRVQADSGMLNLINVQGTHPDGGGVSSIFFASGGFGALAGMDGWATTPSPSNMTGTPIEAWENLTGMTIERKALLVDSGGVGRYRGGLGQEIVLRNDSGGTMTVSILAGRTEFPPMGLNGGGPGRRREIQINGKTVHPKGRYRLEPGDVIATFEAGGGGYGPPERRAQDAILRDLAEGTVSEEAARRDYGHRPKKARRA
ncbi:MAG: hydantoinase B/oxoprolinase family protein [Proteobacteria bacterium]|nr:hydantoinase B/oxoprolinase family protein [Pseudomonadota bacterium]MBI3498204.1 hydantoinase B/oxoprolinase family protein [Pseudomonadota bacterium]